MEDRIAAVLIAMWLIAPAAVVATATPSTPGRAGAEPWLARAQHEIAALTADSPNDLPTLQPYVLAVTVYCLAPTADRRSARDAIIAAVRKNPDSQTDSFYDDLLKLRIRARDPAGLAAVAGVWKAEFEPEASKDAANRLLYARNIAKLAADYAAIGDSASYKVAVETAGNVLPSVDTKPVPWLGDQKAADYLWIAAAHARAGDPVQANRDEAASSKIETLSSVELDPPSWHVAQAYADAGRFDDALAAAAKVRNDPVRELPKYIARRQARAGKFDDAWRTLGPLPTRARAAGEYDLIVRQVQAGQIDSLPARIDAMTSPHERALAEVGVAATLIGRPFAGVLREYQRKED